MGSRREQIDREVLERMLQIASHLSASTSLTEILAVIINAMRDTLDAERATVLEYDPEQHELFSTVAHGLSLGADDRSGAKDAGEASDSAAAVEAIEGIRIPADSGLAGECGQRREVINVPDAYADPRFNADVDRRTGFRTKSILAVPLLDPDGALIGVTQVLNKRGGPFDERDEQVSTALASLAAVAIKRGRLIEDQLARQKLERDLELARRIQQQTFPQTLPELPGFDLDAWSEPAEETGGDAVDVIAIGPEGEPSSVPGRVMLLLADATGHGIGPALNAAQIRAMIRMTARLTGHAAVSLPDIAQQINQQLCDDLPDDRFITAWLGVIDGANGTLIACSAGQAPILRYESASRSVVVTDADTMPFGIIGECEFPHPVPIEMRKGDVLLVASDGILEAADPSGDQYGTDRLVQLLEQHAHESAKAISTAIRQAVADHTLLHPAVDDMTAIVVKAV